jgi:hypothetical protein
MDINTGLMDPAGSEQGGELPRTVKSVKFLDHLYLDGFLKEDCSMSDLVRISLLTTSLRHSSLFFISAAW